MGLVSHGSTWQWPEWGLSFNSTMAVSSRTTLDAAGEYEAYVFSAREAMTVSHVGYKPSTCTGSPTATITLETVDSSTGLPTGTVLGATNNASVTTGTLTTDTWAAHALTEAATIAKGDLVAVKFALATGTSILTPRLQNGAPSPDTALPYTVVNTGTPTKSSAGQTVIFGLGSSSSSFYQLKGVLPITAYATNAFNNTNSARRGMRFAAPYRCRVVGIRHHYVLNNNGAFNAILMDDAGSELSSSSTAFPAGGFFNGSTFVDTMFDNAVVVNKGQFYRAVIEPSSATNCSMPTVTIATDAASGMPGGSNAYYTTYASSVWTDDTTKAALISVLIDAVDVSPAAVIGG